MAKLNESLIDSGAAGVLFFCGSKKYEATPFFCFLNKETMFQLMFFDFIVFFVCVLHAQLVSLCLVWG